MNTIRLPSCDHAASETAVGNVTGAPPMLTVAVPSEISGVPAAYCGPAGEAAEEGADAGAEDDDADVAAGPALGWPEDLPQAEASSATEVAAAAVTSRRREEERLTRGSFPRNGVAL